MEAINHSQLINSTHESEKLLPLPLSPAAKNPLLNKIPSLATTLQYSPEKVEPQQIKSLIPSRKQKELKPLSYPTLFPVDDPSQALSTSLLNHLHGDSFSNGGMPAEPLIEYVAHFLDRLDGLTTQHIFGERGEQKREEIRSLLHSVIHVAAWDKKCETKVKERLKSGLSCLFIGGWAGKPTGHGVYYEIIPEAGGTYTFLAYNRGAGHHYQQPPSKIEAKAYYPGFYQRTHIKAEDLFNEVNWKALKELESALKVPGTEVGTDYSEVDLFQNILGGFGGEENAFDLEMEDLLSQQYGETCAWKSLTAFLRKHLDFNTYQRLMIAVKQHSFWEYTQHRLPTLKISSEEFSFYEKVVENFAHSLERARQLGSLNENEYLLAIVDLKALQQHMERMTAEQRKEAHAAAPKVPASIPPCAVWSSAIVPSPTAAQLDAENIPLQISSTRIPSTTLSMSRVSDQLKEIHAFYRKLMNESKHPQALEHFKQLMAEIPFPTESSFWKQLAKRESKKAIEVAHSWIRIYDTYITWFLESSRERCNSADPSLLLDAYTIICMIDQLLLFSKREDNPLAGINPLPDYRPLAIFLGKPIRSKHVAPAELEKQLRRNFTFQVKDPVMRKRLTALYAYMEKRAQKSGAGTKQPFAFESMEPVPFSLVRSVKKEALSNKGMLNPEFEYCDNIRRDADKLKGIKGIDFDRSPLALLNQIEMKEDNVFVNSWRHMHMRMSHLLMSGIFPLRPFKKNGDEIYWDWTLQFAGSLHDPNRVNHIFNRDYTNVQHPTYRPSLIHASYDDQLEESEKKRWKDMGENLIIPPEEKFSGNFRHIENKTLQTVFSLLVKQPHLSENEVMLMLPEEYRLKIPADEFRQLLLLATNKSLQIDRLLSYYGEHRLALGDADHQTFFKLLFFEYEVLPQALARTPELYQRIFSFIVAGSKLAEHTGDTRMLLFYAALARHVKQEFAFLLNNCKDKEFLKRIEEAEDAAPLFEERAMILSAIQNASFQDPTLQPEVKSLFYSAFLASYPYMEQGPDLLQLALVALGHLKFHPLSEKDQDPEQRREIDQARTLLKSQMRKQKKRASGCSSECLVLF